HVVMTSHGRTGLRRAVLGSVADDLIRHLDCPIIVIPALAAENLHPSAFREKRPAEAPASSSSRTLRQGLSHARGSDPQRRWGFRNCNA
ncbi:MAG TPA: hypothetical protein DEV93_09925, partial [Chloroflexi bacterium]|nr:hypothetical protein [Chloroflexota bacterium]